MVAGLRFAPDDLERFAHATFVAHGLSPTDAEGVARSLVWADLHGVETHGVARIPSYLERLTRGLVDPTPRLTVEGSLPFAARLDGANGMGAVVAQRAMDELLARAESVGIAVVVARRSNHFLMKT